MPEYIHKGLGEAEQIISLFMDHYRSGRITINDNDARLTIERAYKFLAARYEADERWRKKKTGEH